MFIFIIRFFDILFSGLLTGIMICISQGADYKTSSETTNLVIHQATINIFNDKIPFIRIDNYIIVTGRCCLAKSHNDYFYSLIISFSIANG